jgi:rhodanese-related sulfurtransferase
MSEQFFHKPIAEIDVEELALLLANSSTQIQLIDVREPHEIEYACIAGFEFLPLSQFAQWEKQINTRFDRDVETIVMCHHGVRSAQMCQWLLNIGFTKVKNVSGGIDAYSVMVDPSLPRY